MDDQVGSPTRKDGRTTRSRLSADRLVSHVAAQPARSLKLQPKVGDKLAKADAKLVQKRPKQKLDQAGLNAPLPARRGGAAAGATANSTAGLKRVDSGSLVRSSRKGSELTIEALYASRMRDGSACVARADDEPPDEGERARMISDITRLIREPHMPETTRCAGLTLIGWLARRMPGEAPHAIGVSEARQSERRLRAAQRKPR